MKKRITAHITVLMMLFSMLGGMLLSAGASVGSVRYVREMTAGSPAGTYYVETEADLNWLAELVNSGMTMEGYTFLQTKDITLTAENFVPIGYRASSTDYCRFSGTYDGQRHTISNLLFNDTNRDGAGLFGYAYNATLKNIGIESGSVTAANRAGGIAGYGDGCTYINCYNKASITILSGSDGVGGIAGVARNAAYAYGCYNVGTITCKTGGAGGILGWAGTNDNSMAVGCYNAGTLKNTSTLSGSVPMDPIARTSRKIGDFGSCYFLASIYSNIDDYNFSRAQKMTAADNVKMAYVMNHATGSNTNAFTVDASGAIVFSKKETEGVADLRIKAMRGGVLISDTDFDRVLAGGFTVPSAYEGYEVLSAAVGEEAYKVGDFIPAETVAGLTVTLQLAGSFPSLSDYNENTEASAFTVSTARELAKLGEMVDAGNSFAGKTIYVTEDLDFSDYPTWNGIGYGAGSGGGVVADGSIPFSGTFDGQFHHFKNINFKGSTRYLGIFSHTEGAILKNIIFDEGTVHTANRTSGVLVGLMSNTTVMNMENHVSVYADQVSSDADNLGFVSMSTNNSVIKNVVSYGEIGMEDKTAITQQNGGLVGWGYRMTSVDNCIVVGEVAGSTYDPIARGATITNSYYLPHRDETGTMTYEALLSGEASYKLNKNAAANLWGLGEQGPVLDPEHPVFPMHFVVNDADAAVAATDPVIFGTVTEYHAAGEEKTLYAPAGYKAVLGRKYWPMTDLYVTPCYEQTLSLWYSHAAYGITYVTNGGIFTVEPAVTTVNGVATELPDGGIIERSGYCFNGWYDNEQLDGEPITHTPVDVFHEVTYYADWAEMTKISSAKEFLEMKTDGNYVLTADLDFTDVQFTPIGSYDSPFTGHFDGNGHTVSGVKLQSDENYQGLFGVNDGVIRNLILAEDCFVSGNSYVGGIVGDNLGTVENCISRATVGSIGGEAPAAFSLLVQNMRVKSPLPQIRQDAMKRRMDTYDPDLMLLQEANTHWIDFLNTNYVKTGEYEMIYKYRAASSLEGVPVLYKPAKFNLIDSGNFWLSATPDVESKPADAKNYRICSWVMLEEKSTGRYLAAFSVHFDNSTNEVRAINSQTLKDKMDAIRAQYKDYDPMVIVAGDFNCRRGTAPYEILESGDMVDAVYEITTGVAKSRIDHVLISENNLKAIDETFEHLPVEDAAQEIPSDHEGIYLELESLANSRHGTVAGSNSGSIRRCVAEGSVSEGADHGLLVGRNLGVTDTLYYAEGDTKAFGLTVEGCDATAMTTSVATAYGLNQASVFDRFTVVNDELTLLQGGEEPSCLTEEKINEAHQFGDAETVAPTCTESGYTVKTCSLCGYQRRTDAVAAVGHQYAEEAAVDARFHQRACTVCSYVAYDAHLFIEEQLVASCTSHGGTRFACSCGYSYDKWSDDFKSHIWSGLAQKDESVHLWTCSRDAEHTLERAHVFAESKFDATCETAGGTEYTCDCGYAYEVREGEALGHAYGEWSPLDATQHQATCGRDETHVTTAPHEMEAGETTAPTCKEQGYTVYTCKDCGYTCNGDFVEALPHPYVYDAEAGNYRCADCGGVYEFTGDLNGDGSTDTADAILLLRRISGWKGEVPDHAADVNGDGKIKIYDAVLYLQKLVG